ncbi:MAG: hypothetical protein AB7O64_16875 [Methylibium sp.]
MLNVIDEGAREALRIECGASMTSAHGARDEPIGGGLTEHAPCGKA